MHCPSDDISCEVVYALIESFKMSMSYVANSLYMVTYNCLTGRKLQGIYKGEHNVQFTND